MTGDLLIWGNTAVLFSTSVLICLSFDMVRYAWRTRKKR